MADWLERVSAIVALAGVAVLVAAAFLLGFVAGLVALGVALVGLGLVGVWVAWRLDRGVS